VILGSRRRLTTFWLLAKVQNAGRPSTIAYHIATTWGWPVGPLLAMFSTRCSSRYVATSASDIRTWSRRLAIVT
jgi:hypothetical protein